MPESSQVFDARTGQVRTETLSPEAQAELEARRAQEPANAQAEQAVRQQRQADQAALGALLAQPDSAPVTAQHIKMLARLMRLGGK